MSARITAKIMLLALAGSISGFAAGWVIRSFSVSAFTPAGVAAAPRPPDRPPGGSGPKLSSAAQARLDALLAAGSPSARVAAALDLGRLETVDDILALLKSWRRFPDDASERIATAALLKRWLELDAPGSLEYSRLHQPEFLEQLAATWGADHPKEAEAWILKLPPGDDREKLWSGLCLSVAARDPALAWRMLGQADQVSYQVNDNEYSEAGAAIQKLVGKDPDAAIRALDSMPPRLMAAARNAIAVKLAETDPDRAWAWARQQPTESTTVAVLFQSLRQDPAKALEFMRTLSPGELQKILGDDGRFWDAGYTQGFAELLKNDTVLDEKSRQKLAAKIFETGGFADSSPMIPLLNEAAMPKLIREKMELILTIQSRDEASTWANDLPEGPAKTAALDFLAQVSSPDSAGKRGTDSSPAGIQSWDIPEPGDPRLGHLAGDQLGQFINSLDPGNAWKASSLLANLCVDKPETATAWLEHTPLDSRTGPLAAEFSVRWSESDPAAAAAWVKTLPSGPLAETAAANIVRQYDRYAPAEAAAWLNTLPAGSVQDAARAAMVR